MHDLPQAVQNTLEETLQDLDLERIFADDGLADNTQSYSRHCGRARALQPPNQSRINQVHPVLNR